MGKIYRASQASEHDVILVTGDAYVDHPSFPAAVIVRQLQSLGLSVAIIAQPDWRNTQEFKSFGRPRLFFGVTSGAMDSMVANYTSMSMPRKADRMSPGGAAGMRPKRAVAVYCQRLREAYPSAPIVIGGIEASLRRFSHYDFQENKLRDSILTDSHADLLVYGMAETVLKDLVNYFSGSARKPGFPQIPQTAVRVKPGTWRDFVSENFELLPDTESCRKDPVQFIRLSKTIDRSVRPGGPILIQPHPKGDIVCFPPAEHDSPDAFNDRISLQFNRRTHPLYELPVPALEPVQFSITSHRGCLGTCTFCALTAHQGRWIRSRHPESVLDEVRLIAQHPDFRGTIPDIGGPSVNMYGWSCRIGGCKTRYCLFPNRCPNLSGGLAPLASLLTSAREVPGVKHVFLGSGLRFDLLAADDFKAFELIIRSHISGQLKIAPEHVDDRVLKLMRKGDNAMFEEFLKLFASAKAKLQKNVFLVPYFLLAFPGFADADKKLRSFVENQRLVHKQIQEFTPTPGTLATAMYYSRCDLEEKPIWIPTGHCERSSGRTILQK